MNRRCQNCGRALLQSDDKCYHCNMPVPELEKVEQKEPEFKIAGLVRYSIFILLLIVIGLFLMSWMGKNLPVPLTPTPEALIEYTNITLPITTVKKYFPVFSGRTGVKIILHSITKLKNLTCSPATVKITCYG